MQLKIITYNIWDLPLWFVKNRKSRVREAVKYLISTNADIICIQESWHLGNRKDIFYKLFSEAGYVYASGCDKPMVYGNSGLITFSKFPIHSKHFFKFPLLAATFVELFTGRGILETVLETPVGLLRVFNTHLHMPDTFCDRKIRLVQMKYISKVIFEKYKDKMPSMIMGDFNEDRMWEASDFMTHLHRSEYYYPFLGTENGHASTYRLENPLVDIWPNKSDRSKRFDYIFVYNIKKLGLEEISYQPLYLNPVLSDHDPVEIILEYKDIQSISK